MSELAEWTVLVFLNAKNSLEEFAFPNFDQMAAIGSTREVKILIEMGRPKVHHTPIHGAWSKTLRFDLETSRKPEESDAVDDLGATNMGDVQSLVDFVAWGRARRPSKRTMRVIWNHGQGWRAPRPGAPAGAKPVQQAGGFRYVSSDDDTGDKLYNRAIQDGLAGLLRGDKLDVIAFDACLMAMTETAYALRDVARVMVGSEELEPGSGWNYTRWLRPLVDAKGAVDAAGLGRLMVDAMQAEYGDTDATTLSATALERAAALGASLSAFADAAIPQLTAANAPAFRAARAACRGYGEGYGLHSIDLARFMTLVAEGAFDPSVRARAGEVLVRIHEAVFARYASAMRQGAYGSAGLAIYFPASGAAYASDGDGDGYAADNTVYPVEFVEKERWAAFLRAYWAQVP